METFIQQLINGLTLGAVYAMVALGYTMVYGIIQLINFAHGEVVMIGAMVAFSVIVTLMEAETGMPGWSIVLVGTAVAIPVCMAVSFTMERVAYRPLRGAPRLAPLITAIGISIILQHVAMMIWSRNPLAFPQILENRVFHLAGAAVSTVQLAIWGISTLMMGALTLVIYRTRLGIAMRATSQNAQIAGLMGIDIDRVIAATFVAADMKAVTGVGEPW